MFQRISPTCIQQALPLIFYHSRGKVAFDYFQTTRAKYPAALPISGRSGQVIIGNILR